MGNFPLATADTNDRLDFVEKSNGAYSEFTISKTIGNATTAAVSHAIPVDIPANSIVDYVYLRCKTAWAIGAAGTSPVNMEIGTTASPNLYAAFTTTNVDAVGEEQFVIPALHQPSSAAETININQTDSSHALQGTFTGEWYILMVGRTFKPLSKI